MGTLIDVNVFDEYVNQEVTMLAKIVEESKETYKVKFMSPAKGGLYRYEEELTEVEKNAVSGFYDTDDERSAGFIPAHDGCFELIEDDENYEIESEPESESESESVDESEDESEEEENVDE